MRSNGSEEGAAARQENFEEESAVSCRSWRSCGIGASWHPDHGTGDRGRRSGSRSYFWCRSRARSTGDLGGCRRSNSTSSSRGGDGGGGGGGSSNDPCSNLAATGSRRLSANGGAGRRRFAGSGDGGGSTGLHDDQCKRNHNIALFSVQADLPVAGS